MMIGQPAFISIEPTTACNLRCPECPSGLRKFDRPTGNMKLDLFEKILGAIGKQLISIHFYFQGEPYIHPDFLKMIQKAKNQRIMSICSTNGHFLDSETSKATVQSGLDKLIISIDGTSQEVYEQYRVSGNLNQVIEGVKQVVEWKRRLKSKTPYLIIQFLVVRPNEHQIGEIQDMGMRLGVDEVKLKTAQIYDYHNGSALIPEQDLYSRYARQTDGKYQIKNDQLNQCWRMWSGFVVCWDGRVVPCCFDKDAQHQLFKFPDSSMREGWKSVAYVDFRQRLLRSRSEINICQNCTEGTKVWNPKFFKRLYRKSL